MRPIQIWARTFAVVGLALGAGPTGAEETKMTGTARGTFEVEMTPQPPRDGVAEGLGQFLLEKAYSGDLAGTATGEMLTAARLPMCI